MGMFGGAGQPAPTAGPTTPAAPADPSFWDIASQMFFRGGSPADAALAVRQREYQNNLIQAMPQVLASLPDDQRAAAIADPAAFWTNYTKRFAPQANKAGDTIQYDGPEGPAITAPLMSVDNASGNAITQRPDSTTVTGQLGGDFDATNGMILSKRNGGVAGTFTMPQILPPGSTPGTFAPQVSGAGPGLQPPPSGPLDTSWYAGQVPQVGAANASAAAGSSGSAAPAAPPVAASATPASAGWNLGNPVGRPTPMGPAERARWNIPPSDPRQYMLGADGKPAPIAEAAYGPTDVLKQRTDFFKDPMWTDYTNSVEAANAIENLFTSFGKNNSVLDQAALDNGIRTITGLSARQQSVVNFTDHMGLPDQLRGAIQQKFGNGYLTPDIVLGIRDMIRAYAMGHQDLAQWRLQNEQGFAKQQGQDFGVSALPQMEAKHIVPYLDKNGVRQGGVPPVPQREVGAVYATPRGLAKWMGTGWLRVQ